MYQTLTKCILCLCCSILAMGAIAADQDESGQLITVDAEGIGSSQDEAIEMALQSAVAEAVGSLVTAKTLVENGKIVNDTIIAHSGGFVEQYEILKGPEPIDSGRIFVRIRAQVGSTRLISSLKKINVVVNEFHGSNLAGQSFSIDLSRNTAKETWETFIDDFLVPQKMYSGSLIEYSLVETSGDQSLVRFIYRLEPNTSYYYEQCLPAIEVLAGQTCLYQADDEFEIKLQKRRPWDVYNEGADGGGNSYGAPVWGVDQKELYKRFRKAQDKFPEEFPSTARVLFLQTGIDGNKSRWRGYLFDDGIFATIWSRMCKYGVREQVKDSGYYSGFRGVPHSSRVTSFRFLDDTNVDVAAPKFEVLEGAICPGNAVDEDGSMFGPNMISRVNGIPIKETPLYLACAPMFCQFGGDPGVGHNMISALEFSTLLRMKTSDLGRVEKILIEIGDYGRGDMSSDDGALVILENSDSRLKLIREDDTKIRELGEGMVEVKFYEDSFRGELLRPGFTAKEFPLDK